jgi:nitrogen regulatory protein PII
MVGTKLKLLCIITVFEGVATVEEELSKQGVRGYSSWHVRGRGAHGRKRGGILEADNQMFQTVTTADRAQKLLEWVERDLTQTYPSVAYAVDVDAVPSGHFGS